ncbi:MAG: replicative DNA helicase [Candidatus Omnitrophica bacterium]|nr:replicative DNA helicase [Candidatus Omnitrophota bacterium]MCG2702834.1 replicative DNA helicase [Candidatus Omnitrophota bacterium]
MGSKKVKIRPGEIAAQGSLLIDKIPPQNIEAEMAVLGSMLLEEEAISQVVELLDESSFYQENHRIIFKALISLYSDSKPVDLITLTEQLRKEESLERIGGAGYITELANVVPTSANVVHYAKIVKEKALLRNLITTATHIVTEGYEPDQEVDTLLDKAERLIFEISGSKIKGGFFSVKELIKDSIETIEKLYQKKTQVTGIPTGFQDLDVITAGFQPADLIILAGRPSMGKSALMCGVAEHAAVIDKVPTAIFSLEMSKEQLVQRILCSHARVNMQNVRTGFLSQEHWGSLVNAAGKISNAPLFIDDTPGVTVLEMRAKARRLKSQHNIGLVILDYLQLMQSSSSRAENRQQEISDISRSLKALARELNVPVIAVSQLSRATEQREGCRPRLSDLRDSGAIEQDADVVLLLFREEYYNPTPQNEGLAEVNVAKQRNGPVGTKKLTFLKEFSRFENYTQREE